MPSWRQFFGLHPPAYRPPATTCAFSLAKHGCLPGKRKEEKEETAYHIACPGCGYLLSADLIH